MPYESMPLPEAAPEIDAEEALIRQLPAKEIPIDIERDRIDRTLNERDALERDRVKLADAVARDYPDDIARIQRLADSARGILPDNQIVTTKDLEWAYARPGVQALMENNQNLAQAETILQSARRPNVVRGLFNQKPQEPDTIPEGYPQEHLEPIRPDEARQ